ncbi:MAG: LamB/YcsF family protein [Alphaproteobacteria bacterium]|nr:LamB/YcsF family protein [Alphaproteobacteria bacterium]
MRVDLNSDMGESFGPWVMGDDAAMLDIVTSANVACGFHGGDPDIMRATCEMAKARGVAVGAHPGFRDLQGFGRRQVVGLSAREIENLIAYQIGALRAIAATVGHKVTYVKAHGALSNMACVDPAMARAIAAGIKAVDPKLIFVVIPLTELARAGEAAGLSLAREIYADRAYEDDGTLVSRKKPGAVLHDAKAVADRVLRMVQEQAILSVNGKRLPLAVETICIHGDSPGAVGMARAVRETLTAAGISLAPFSSR